MKHKIEFVSYDGEYPVLCDGRLVLRIDGKEYSFGYNHRFCWEKRPNCDYPPFWESGGTCSFNPEWESNVTKDKWYVSGNLDPKVYPECVIDNIDMIMDLFNANVPWGCCGGCL